MCYFAGVGVLECGDQLFEDVPGCFFGELFGLADEAEELAVLLYFHDVVEDPLDFAVGGAVNTSHIEVDYLNNVSMLGLVGHLDLVEEDLQALLLVGPLGVGFFDLLVHDFDSDSLVVH